MSKTGYYLIGAYNSRSDTQNMVKSISKRPGVDQYTVVFDGVNNGELDIYLVWAKKA